MAISTQIKARKEQRKEARKNKKKRSLLKLEDVVHHNHDGDGPKGKKRKSDAHRDHPQQAEKKVKTMKEGMEKDVDKKMKKKKKVNGGLSGVNMNVVDPAMAAAIRRDEEEIAELETKLGLTTASSKSSKEKARLYKEYSKLEGFGDDFGDFLEDLDQLVVRLKQPSSSSSKTKISTSKPMSSKKSRKDDDDDDEDSYDEDDDNQSNSKEKDDEAFKYDRNYKYNGDNGTDERSLLSSDGEEVVPMKDPYETLDDDDSVLEELERMEQEEKRRKEKAEKTTHDYRRVNLKSEDVDSDSSTEEGDGDGDDDDHINQESDEGDNQVEVAPDHDEADTYKPTFGEDIYGNKVYSSASDTSTRKYVPPHLRSKQTTDEDDADRERRLNIRRSLNNALNRLSEDTLVSVAQQVAHLYSSNPTKMVDELIWKNAKDVCVETPVLMHGLIPLYTACIAGVHIQTGDTIQLGESMLEYVVVDLWGCLSSMREKLSQHKAPSTLMEDDSDLESRHICNMTLILGYMYNYQIVHCSFMYDVIRQLIENFTEIDIECLLLLLSHCGGALRSDDPLALKQIVLLVQKKTSEKPELASSSRAQYMVSAIMDLKNNRRKKQDTVYAEKTLKLRKLIGRIKSNASRLGISKTSSESSARILVEDVLNAETKGRWWKVGASWVGNQYRFTEDSKSDEANDNDQGSRMKELVGDGEEEDEELLKLAAKFRMNTDRKRSIFCIIMSGNDCEDTFEKLCRSSMLQNRSERDTVRVLMECCGKEKTYNKFYGHLAARICEFQPQSKFSIQLAYWDAFKQLDSMPVRRAANLAKLLVDLVGTHQILRLLPVIKPIDFSDTEMGENIAVFVTIVLSSILDYYDDPLAAKALFERQQKQPDILDEEQEDKEEGIRAGLLVFLIETLKSSPKNKKGSRFRKNFKAVVKALDTNGLDF